MAVIDISRPLGPSTPVWPGDVAVSVEQTLARADGDPVDSSAWRLSVHAGTHVDAPVHVLAGRGGVETLDLDRCLGSARVVDVGDAASIEPEALGPLQGVSRLLIKSRCSLGHPGARVWPFPALTVAAAEAVVAAGLVLVGVDAPSVDPADTDDLPVHHLLLDADVVVLENLWLADAAPGDYELVALPLALQGSDGSPVRAVLRTLDGP